MTTAEEVEAIKELDRLWVEARRANTREAWDAYFLARQRFERLGVRRGTEQREEAA